jgi:quinoprotein glucose dehydrogenase
MKPTILFSLIALAAFTFFASRNVLPTADPAGQNWPEYLGGPDRSHFSALAQINTENVQTLQQAWQYSAPDSGQMQVNPIVVNGVLYGVTAAVQAFALDASSGREIWRFGDPLKAWHSTSRGVAYWTDGQDRRILYTVGPHIYALDARTGQKIISFGDSGRADLHAGLGQQAKNKLVLSNTPGTVFEDLIVMPVRLAEWADAAPGYIQAFNVKTGKLAWVFRTIPNPGEPGYETWGKTNYQNFDVGGANNWAGMAVDRQRGIIYVPTGSAAFDFYGGNRPGKNLYANCLLALDARTGKRLWHFQAVHHDIWDRDFPAPPNLLTITQHGKKVDAVAQITKSGHVFVFDRVTGRPLFPIEERPVPQSDLVGEKSWPTQPFPTKPAPFARQTLTEADINPLSPEHDSLVRVFRQVKKGPFMPPSKQGTIIFPGLDGGGEWGGAATDPNGIMYVNSNECAWLFKMQDVPKPDALAHLGTGERLYVQNCAVCHGNERKGNPHSGYPGLVDIGSRRTRDYVAQTIANGKGMMPGFTQLSADEKRALLGFLFGDEKQELSGAVVGVKRPFIPFRMSGYTKFQDSRGNPGIKAPWGTLNAIDLNTGDYLWKVPFGEEPALAAKGIPQTGTENYGGPVVTAGGLLFIAATKDGMFRAYDKKTGRVLWQTKLPAAGFATPCTYQVGGKQFVVVACGGVKLGQPKGNQYVAFALP